MLRGMIAIHQDLLADHFALALDLLRRENAAARYMSPSTSHSCGKCGARGLRVVTGVILGGEGVEVSADTFDRFGDLVGPCAASCL